MTASDHFRRRNSAMRASATRHTLVAPISAADVVRSHLCRHPITAGQIVRVLDVSPKALRRVLRGKRPSAKFAARWARATGQDIEAMWAARKAWSKADRKLAKERNR